MPKPENQWAHQMLDQLADTGMYGEITLRLRAGQVKGIVRNESFVPPGQASHEMSASQADRQPQKSRREIVELSKRG